MADPKELVNGSILDLVQLGNEWKMHNSNSNIIERQKTEMKVIQQLQKLIPHDRRMVEPIIESSALNDGTKLKDFLSSIGKYFLLITNWERRPPRL